MMSLNNTAKKYYNEGEAAHVLRISVDTLHKILDAHVFTDENPRPEEIELTAALAGISLIILAAGAIGSLVWLGRLP